MKTQDELESLPTTNLSHKIGGSETNKKSNGKFMICKYRTDRMTKTLFFMGCNVSLWLILHNQ